jgi:hypothetical protein
MVNKIEQYFTMHIYLSYVFNKKSGDVILTQEDLDQLLSFIYFLSKKNALMNTYKKKKIKIKLCLLSDTLMDVFVFSFAFLSFGSSIKKTNMIHNE